MTRSRSPSPSRSFGSTLFQVEFPNIFPELLASEFKVTGQPPETAEELYQSLASERQRIFKFMDDLVLVNYANSPAGLSHTFLRQQRGEVVNNPLHDLVKTESLGKSRHSIYATNMKYPVLVRQLKETQDRTRELAEMKAKFADIITSSTAPSFDKQNYLDFYIPAIASCNAVSTFTLMMKRQLALLGNTQNFWEQSLSITLGSEQPDLTIALMSCGMSADITIYSARQTQPQPLLCFLLEDYAAAIVSMSPPPDQTDFQQDDDRTICAAEISVYLKEKVAGLMKLIRAMQENKVNLEDENVKKSAQHVADTLREYVHLHDDLTVLYKWVLEAFNIRQGLTKHR